MRRHSSLSWRTLTNACVMSLLLVGCDSGEPAGPSGSDEPKSPDEPVQGLRLEARSATMPIGTVGTTVGPVPVVRLTLNGNPVAGREVRFAVSDGGSTGIASQRTDTAGLASPGSWTLGTRARRQTLIARVAGAADVVVTAVAQAAQPDTMLIVGGNHQTAGVGAPLPDPLRVRLADRYGNPVPEWPVAYTVVMGAGTVAGATVTSDSLGFATSGVWTLGGEGAQVTRASVPGKDALFQAFACGDPCGGRDLLFVSGDQRDRLYSLINGVPTLLYTAPSGSTSWSPAWSPDGRQIAFTLGTYDTQLCLSHVALYVMNADGSNAVLRADGFSDPSWSPDGRRLAVTGPNGVYTLSVQADGAAPLLLAENAEDAAWSPDGSKIAYIAWQDKSLRMVNPDGSGVTTLAQFDGWGLRPTWAPDSRRLAYGTCSGPCTVLIVSLGGADLVGIAGASGLGLAWSPDGSRIAFDTPNGIAWLPADGSFSQPILMTEGGFSAAWRP